MRLIVNNQHRLIAIENNLNAQADRVEKLPAGFALHKHITAKKYIPDGYAIYLDTPNCDETGLINGKRTAAKAQKSMTDGKC